MLQEVFGFGMSQRVVLEDGESYLATWYLLGYQHMTLLLLKDLSRLTCYSTLMNGVIFVRQLNYGKNNVMVDIGPIRHGITREQPFTSLIHPVTGTKYFAVDIRTC